ncbi:hypothetical protein ACFVFS_05575 [Kitasatospora sp. NPDC057692]|uniref:hypothetical protein n=1 Tax=Kitasatospora sp. NPDC057692 TaxID=3346215 RepID=UPI0036B57065
MAGYPPGLVLGRVVQLGALALGMVDGAGVAWAVGKDGLRGWGGSAVRTQYSDRQADHGVWAGRTYMGARVITLAGTITAPDAATLDEAVEQLLEAASLDDTLLTVGETIPKQAVVRRSGEPLVDPETDRIARFSVMLTAEDPRRYSTVLQAPAPVGLPVSGGGVTLPITLPLVIPAGSSSGSLTLTNEGSADTRPTFTVTGPVGGFTILVQYPDATVRALTYSDTLLAGEQLLIDTDAHSVTLGGAVSRRRYLSGQWPTIPPHQTVTVQWTSPAPDPAALLAATVRSAWL